MGEEGGGHNVLTKGIFSIILLNNVLIYMKNSYFLASLGELGDNKMLQYTCMHTHTHADTHTHKKKKILPQADWASVSVQ